MLRSPDSLSDKDTIIEDPALEPFFITNTPGNGYTVFERVTTSKNGKSNKYIKIISYPSNFNYALKTIAKHKLNSDQKQYNSLKEYVGKWEEISDNMSKLTSIN